MNANAVSQLKFLFESQAIHMMIISVLVVSRGYSVQPRVKNDMNCSGKRTLSHNVILSPSQ